MISLFHAGTPKVAPEHMIAVLMALDILLVSFAVFGNNGSMDIFLDNTSPRMKAFVPQPGEDTTGQDFSFLLASFDSVH